MAEAARLSIPTFKGEGDLADLKTQATKFLVDLRSYFVDRGLVQDATRISAMGRCFVSGSAAELWWHGYTNGAGKDIAIYDEVVNAFRKRFVPADTLLQMAQQRETLIQKATESVAAYNDRVIVFSNTVDGKINEGLDALLRASLTPERVADADDRTAIIQELKNGFTLLHTNVCGSLNFCAGIHGTLKQELFKTPNVTTKADLMEGAKRCETAAHDSKPRAAPPVVVAGLEGQQQQTRNQDTRGFGKPAWLPLSALPPNTCYRCGFMRVRDPAKHNAKNCRQKPENFKWKEVIRFVNQRKAEQGQTGANAAMAVNYNNPPFPMRQQQQPAGPWAAPQQQHPPPQVFAAHPPAPPPQVPQPPPPTASPAQANAMAFPFAQGSYGDF